MVLCTLLHWSEENRVRTNILQKARAGEKEVREQRLSREDETGVLGGESVVKVGSTVGSICADEYPPDVWGESLRNNLPSLVCTQVHLVFDFVMDHPPV